MAKDYKWLIYRLKSMSVAEIVWRFQQKALQFIEKKTTYNSHKPVTEVRANRKLEGLKPDANNIGINWKNENYDLFHGLDLFGVYDYNEYKMKWNAGFQTENAWPVDECSYNINISQRTDIGDIRTNWELNRHFQFVCLAKNYYVTGNEEYLKELKLLFYDWNCNNKFLHGVQWTSAMEIAIRIVSWSLMYAFICKKGCDDEKFLCDITNGIKVMANYVYKHRARFSSANNHLIIEMLGIGLAGLLFGYDKWIDSSIKILTKELVTQNYSDGVNKEMSLHYQAFVMEAYAIFWILLNRRNISVPDIWKEQLTKMSRFVADCVGNYGEVIVFGDNDEGKLLDFNGRLEGYYDYVLQLMGCVLEERYTSSKFIENVAWLINNNEEREYCRKEMYIPKEISSYEIGGYTILRSDDRKVLVGIDHAELGYGSIAAHGHEDCLSVQLFFCGEPMLVDSGTYNYHFDKQLRDDIRRGSAHNTINVKGKAMAEIKGPFLWGRRHEKPTIKIEEKENLTIIKIILNYDDIEVRRTILFDKKKELILEDSVNKKTEYEQNWILGKNVYYELRDIEGIELNSNFMSMHFSNSNIIEGKTRYSHKYNHFEDTSYIKHISNGEKIITKISLL
ncbi:MAG: alginate lyase family protein [Lachnospiraceae bacterium]|nr:alginate lyase family protein [Lachnospiraceae bacterium]